MPVVAVGVAAAGAFAVCAAVSKVTAVATWSPSSVTVTGLARPKLAQPRLTNDMLSRLPMKVARVADRRDRGAEIQLLVMSSWLRADWMFDRFWQ